MARFQLSEQRAGPGGRVWELSLRLAQACPVTSDLSARGPRWPTCDVVDRGVEVGSSCL